MAPNKSLSEQQYNVLQQHLPAYHVRLLTGADNVDTWTDQAWWNAFLAGVHVVVGTPAVLCEALTHGFVAMCRLSLCIFDEAHRCIKNGPMNQIMRDFYHPAKLRGEPIPSILALSASPVMNSHADETGLRAIECNLDSTTITPKQYSGDLDTHSHEPDLIRVVYDDCTTNSDSPAYDALNAEVERYNLDQDPYVLELLEQNDIVAHRLLEKVFARKKTYCTEQIRSLHKAAFHVGQQLGSSMAEWLVCTCARRFLNNNEDISSLVVDLQARERRHLKGILKRIISNASNNGFLTPDIHGASDKAKALHDILLDGVGSSSQVIVFVNQRAMVVALAHLLQYPEVSRSRRISTFVGTSTTAGRDTSLSDIVDYSTQSQDLQAFRDGTKNVMIATSALEEGIDVPACNGVICFDLPQNLISFVQRRGRARQARSMYILLVALDSPEHVVARWQELEDKMKEAYMDEERVLMHLNSAGAANDGSTSSVQYIVPSTGALLTMDNASSHLQHFCATRTLNASRYIDPRREFHANQDLASNMWTASVTLPSFVHTSLRIAKSDRLWSGEQAAIKNAAFNAYIALHKAGLVNDNLLPITNKPAPEPAQRHVDQPSLIQVSEQLSAWNTCYDPATQPASPWYASVIKLYLRGRQLLSQVIWLPFQIEAAERIHLHWNAQTAYEASVEPMICGPLNNHDRSKAAEWTSLVLRSVSAYRMSDDEKFAFLLSPPSSYTDHDSYESYVDEQTIRRRLATNHHTECGIVSVAGQLGKAYILQDVRDTTTGTHANNHTGGPSDMQLIVTAFPKRRDFLHPPLNESHTAYTSRQSFPVSDCTISRLPICHSLLAIFLPSVIHRIDVVYVAHRLSTGILALVGINNTALVSEALSSPAAREQIGDYNRLEYLGDGILKFCTALQTFAQHPTWPEAFLTAEKDRIVRNSNLAKASLQAGLDRFIITKSFTGSKWRPSHLRDSMVNSSRSREMSSKVLADVVEALIGAAYVDGGLPRAYKCIQALLPDEAWWDSGLLFGEILGEAECGDALNMSPLEELIGHRFEHPSLLLEAITHASYASNRNGLSYERLEFLGDAVLDLIITPKLHAHKRKLRHWDLHHVHEALVNGRFLAFCCLSLRGEQEKYHLVNTFSNSIPQSKPHADAQAYHLHDFIRAGGQVALVKQHTISRFDSLRDRIASTLQTGELYPWSDLTALHPEKFFSDIVESILGAIFIDTRGDLSVCEVFLEKLGVLPTMRDILDRNVETTFPKERVGILANREHVKYVLRPVVGDEGGWICTVLVGTRDVAESGRCDTREEAEVRAADAAILELFIAMEDDVRSKLRNLDVRNVDELHDA